MTLPRLEYEFESHIPLQEERMMILQLTDRHNLPKTAIDGDIAIVNDGAYPERYYVYRNSRWHHEKNYVCPLNASDLDNEPNV